MVDAAVVASVAATKAERALHVDVLLQRVVLTELGQAGTLAEAAGRERKVHGLSKVMDLWAKLIAGRFVQQTRFDPFHHGETEQDLYDRLPGWIEEIGRDEGALLTLEYRGKIHTAEISAEEMKGAVRASYQEVVNLVRAVAATGGRPALVLTQTLSNLPGLQSELEEVVGSEAVVLAPAAAATGALQQQHLLVRAGDQEVDFVAELPIESLSGQPVATPETFSQITWSSIGDEEEAPDSSSL